MNTTYTSSSSSSSSSLKHHPRCNTTRTKYTSKLPSFMDSFNNNDDNIKCVDVSSKTDYYDNDRTLKNWGFDDNTCHNCLKRNSDLYGLLMQCAKCKKAYYCSMKCFNDHLPEHQKFCTSKEICHEPNGKPSPFEIPNKPDEKIIETFTDSKTKIKLNNEDDDDDDVAYNGEEPAHEERNHDMEGEDDVYEEEEEKEVSEYPLEDDDDEDSMVGLVVDATRDLDLDLECSMHSLTLPDNAAASDTLKSSMSLYHKSCSGLMNPNTSLRPHTELYTNGSDSWKMEEVDLRHTEQIKNHYSWSTPDWVNERKLRSTSRGQILQNGVGDIISPVTNAKILIDQGIVTWKVPEWTTPKLRKTPLGEKIKQQQQQHNA